MTTDESPSSKSTAQTPSHSSAWTAIFLLAILVVSAWGTFAPKHYEYKVAGSPDDTLERDLNRIGEEGWEVISARRATKDASLSKPEMMYEFVLKRQRPF